MKACKSKSRLVEEKRTKRDFCGESLQPRVSLNQLITVSSRLWVGGCWYSNTTLRAYVSKYRLDDSEVGDLGTLVMQMEISVSGGK